MLKDMKRVIRKQAARDMIEDVTGLVILVVMVVAVVFLFLGLAGSDVVPV